MVKQEKYLPQSDRPLYGANILVVDDNPTNVMIAKNFLKKWGALVHIAENGLEAYDQFISSSFDLILMDLHMPVMGGLEASAKMREHEFQQNITEEDKTPIIAFTADVFTSDAVCSEHGISDTLYKPFDLDVFKNLMTSYSLTNRPLNAGSAFI